MKRIVELDGLRGLLALWVVFYHMCGTLPVIKSIFSEHASIVLEAWFPVDVFFMMSGFVMMHVYGDQFTGTFKFARYKHFMVARFARLYPVHLLSLFVLLLIMLPNLIHTSEFYSADGRYSIGSFIYSLLMLQAPWLLTRSWNYPAWSISAEWHVYIFFPLLMLVVNRIAKKFVIPTIVLLILLVFFLYCSDMGNEKYPTNGVGVMLRAIPLFYCGMALYRFIAETDGGLSVRDRFVFFIFAGLLVVLWTEQMAAFAVLFVPVLIYITLHSKLLSLIFSSRIPLFLGKISYSMYMTHALVQAVFLIAIPNVLHKMHLFDLMHGSLFVQMLFYLISVMMSVFIGWLVCMFVEVPMRKLVVAKLG